MRSERLVLCALTALAVSAVPAPAADLAPPHDLAAPPADAETTDSGLAFKVLQPGSGDRSPDANDLVVVQYAGWTADGELFDTTYGKNAGVKVPLALVIDGWAEGLQQMVTGEKRRLWIPEELAYKGQEGKPAGMLVFDVELVDVLPVPETPADVAAPPEAAEAGPKGLYSLVLRSGTGDRHPKVRDTVLVQYAGWTTDGEMFDSSWLRGEPASFELDQVIRGWTLGLKEMVEGEKRRLWIPEELAYKGQEGKPAGMLVFDVELLEIR